MIPIGFLIDSWTWVEYFRGRNPRVRDYIENESHDIVTSSISLTEITRFLAHHDQQKETIQEVVDEIRTRGIIIPVSEEIAITAGTLQEKDFTGGIADRIILATARLGNHKIITGDAHFRTVRNVIFLKTTR